MFFNLQQCPLRKNITLQATQPCTICHQTSPDHAVSCGAAHPSRSGEGERVGEAEGEAEGPGVYGTSSSTDYAT